MKIVNDKKKMSNMLGFASAVRIVSTIYHKRQTALRKQVARVILCVPCVRFFLERNGTDYDQRYYYNF